MKNCQEILVQYWYDQIDLESIRQWAYAYIENNDDIPDEIFELFDADIYQFESALLRLSRAVDPGFSSQSIRAEVLAAKHFIDIAYDYLNDKTTPMDMCRVVNKIDTGFLGAPRELPDNICYYPTWLGDLYHGCDWCDETWTNSNATHLKEMLNTQIIAIRQWIESQDK